MTKTKTKTRLNNLIKMRNKAKVSNMNNVVVKLQLRIDNIYKQTKNKSLLEWK